MELRLEGVHISGKFMGQACFVFFLRNFDADTETGNVSNVSNCDTTKHLFSNCKLLEQVTVNEQRKTASPQVEDGTTPFRSIDHVCNVQERYHARPSVASSIQNGMIVQLCFEIVFNSFQV